jgi:transcription antitermination factor NusG
MQRAAGEKQWYAIHVRKGFERVVAIHLEQKGYEQYLPLDKRRRLPLDGEQVADDVLFPGYVFAKCDVLDQLLFRLIPGVISVVRCGDTSSAVPEEKIVALKSIIESGLKYKPSASIAIGQPVSVEHGPLRGLRGVCVGAGSKLRLIISVPLLERSVSVEIDRRWLKPVAAPKHRRAAAAS